MLFIINISIWTLRLHAVIIHSSSLDNRKSTVSRPYETILTDSFKVELNFPGFSCTYLASFSVNRFARQPDQWKSRQASQQSALKEFYATFGPTDTKSLVKENFLADTHSKPKQEKLKDIRKEIETTLASAKTSNTPLLAHQVSKKVKRSKDEKKRHRKDGQSESQRKKTKV